MYAHSPKRWFIGATAWAVSGLFLPLQIVIVLQWPHRYSIFDNAISDLGVTSCGVFADSAATARLVCSPWHALYNSGVVACGALTTVGAVLLYGRWTSLTGRTGSVLAAVSGVFVIAVGLAPWDVFPDFHDGVALAQGLAQWAAMVLLAIAAGGGAFRVITLAAVVVSVAAFLDFLVSLEGVGPAVLPFGIAERLAFDTLTLWTASVGAALLVTSRAVSRPPATPTVARRSE